MTESMKILIKKKLYATYIVSSPWVLAAAAALLAAIIATFALHNYRLEKALMREVLEQRAATLVRVLYSSIRVTMRNELRQQGQLGSDWPVQLQQALERVQDDHEVRFLCVADSTGKILAHTDPAKKGSHTDLASAGRGRDIRFQLAGEAGMGQVLQASTRAVFFRHERGPGLPPLPPPFLNQTPRPPYGWTPGRRAGFPFALPERQTLLLSVGLDAHDYEQALSRLRGQIGLLSLAMLLAGLGGWLSLAAVQGYRVSQKTVEKVQAYTVLLIAQLPQGVIATTPEGRIETWNAAMSALTGRESRKALGRLPSEVLPPDLASFFEESSAMDAVGGVRRLTLELAGKRRVLLCQPLKITDAVQSYRGRVLLLSDITELNDLEVQMRENERLAAIGRMAGGVAHEVRNPLSSIKGLAYLLKNKFPVGSREEECAGLLVQETERLNRTITEMLDLTRPAPLHLGPVDMVELIRQSLALMQAELQEHRITVSLRCDAALPPVPGDADRLRQVLMNLLLNAQQAMGTGGTLTVSAGLAQEGRIMEIRVEDTGQGIPAELLPRVFDPYMTTREGGSGIGLAISRKIVTEHKGSIEIQSCEGSGTSVWLHLPLGNLAKFV